MVSQTFHSQPVAFATGTLLSGRYRLLREIGRGPAATVYLALDTRQGIEVALRVVRLGAQDQARLRREVFAAWDIEHDHVVRVQGCFEEGEFSCLVLDFIPGPDLGRRVAETGPLSPDEAAAVGRGIGLALRAAHRRGILHRQVTPGNILIAPETRALLADFGAAGLGARRASSRDFAAPEVLSGQPADARSDVYSLGLCLYFALTGRLPARQLPDRPPLPAADGHRPARLVPGLPDWLDEAVAAATAALPADRYPSAGRFAEVLTPVRGSGPFRIDPAPVIVRS